MKTKVMVLALMAGGSMFAATHVSFGVNIGAVDPVCAPPAYNTYVHPGYDGRYDYRAFHRDHDRDRDRARVRDDDRGYSNDFRHR